MERCQYAHPVEYQRSGYWVKPIVATNVLNSALALGSGNNFLLRVLSNGQPERLGLQKTYGKGGYLFSQSEQVLALLPAPPATIESLRLASSAPLDKFVR
jgi:hypothetical protein